MVIYVVPVCEAPITVHATQIQSKVSSAAFPMPCQSEFINLQRKDCEVSYKGLLHPPKNSLKYSCECTKLTAKRTCQLPVCWRSGGARVPVFRDESVLSLLPCVPHRRMPAVGCRTARHRLKLARLCGLNVLCLPAFPHPIKQDYFTSV